jgi:hypothetical protein
MRFPPPVLSSPSQTPFTDSPRLFQTPKSFPFTASTALNQNQSPSS